MEHRYHKCTIRGATPIGQVLYYLVDWLVILLGVSKPSVGIEPSVRKLLRQYFLNFYDCILFLFPGFTNSP